MYRLFATLIPEYGVPVMLSNDHQQFSKKHILCQERIRQARLAFNLSVGFVGASAAFTLGGIIFMFAGGYISPGVYAALGGLTAVGRHCMQLNREANDRLDRMVKELDNFTKIE
ncbi:MAG: hypothetical protein EA343_21465 [Nodularia sp. (in: Bacteria)]|nr:MAG: hypothetical protein EA343_21465 [Nodularia sp. (in: cyanobacteria)]